MRSTKNSIISLCFIFIILVIFSSCSVIFNRSYLQVDDYDEGYYVSIPETDIIEVRNGTVMRDALESMISAHKSGGTIRTKNYTGDVNVDLSIAIDKARTEFPLGNYAVDFINQDLKEFIAYYEIDIEINYKRTPEEIANIIKPVGSELYTKIDEVLDNFDSSIIFETRARISETLINTYIQQRMEENPELMPEMPIITIEAFPNMTNPSKIVAIEFKYTNSIDVLELMKLNYKWRKEYEASLQFEGQYETPPESPINPDIVDVNTEPPEDTLIDDPDGDITPEITDDEPPTDDDPFIEPISPTLDELNPEVSPTPQPDDID